MQQKAKGQIQQEEAMQASGLLREEIALLYEECTEKLVEVEHDLMDIAQLRADISQEFINRVFRAFHSVKGAAAYLLHEPMKELSHAAESVLSEVREGRIVLTAPLAEDLLATVSRLKEMAEDIDRALEIDYRLEIATLKTILSRASAASVVLDMGSTAADMTPPAPSVSNTSSSARRLKILVVEDELTSRMVLQELLSKYGDCHIAVNGDEAVEAFQAAMRERKGYDLVCMDVRMPVMEGPEAVRRIRSLEEREGIYSSKGVKIFMTTSIQDIKTITSAFKALCDTYLFKPIESVRLDEHLRAFKLVG